MGVTNFGNHTRARMPWPDHQAAWQRDSPVRVTRMGIPNSLSSDLLSFVHSRWGATAGAKVSVVRDFVGEQLPGSQEPGLDAGFDKCAKPMRMSMLVLSWCSEGCCSLGRFKRSRTERRNRNVESLPSPIVIKHISYG